jgi:phenylalanyl-tRNA synthetase alpha chain
LPDDGRGRPDPVLVELQGAVVPYLTEQQLARALTLADLTDPAYGPHCMQQLVAGATGALRERWACPVLVQRAGRVVPVADNDDALG